MQLWILGDNRKKNLRMDFQLPLKFEMISNEENKLFLECLSSNSGTLLNYRIQNGYTKA